VNRKKFIEILKSIRAHYFFGTKVCFPKVECLVSVNDILHIVSKVFNKVRERITVLKDHKKHNPKWMFDEKSRIQGDFQDFRSNMLP
jgi:predicted RNA-binding protein with EMAP domain